MIGLYGSDGAVYRGEKVVAMEVSSEVFDGYVRRMQEIRLLSTPDLSMINEADEYSSTLVRNFSKIGKMAVENRKIMDEFTKHVLSSNEKLSEEVKEQLRAFSESLISGSSNEEVDVHLSEVIAERLMNDDISSIDNDDDNSKAISMAKKVKRDYYVISGLTRYYNPKTEDVRRVAIENSNALAKYLDKERFKGLNDEARGAVLHFSLMGTLLYENNLQAMPDEYWEKSFSILEKGEKILSDPFFCTG